MEARDLIMLSIRNGGLFFGINDLHGWMTWLLGRMMGGQSWSFVCEQDGTTTGKTKGQEPMRNMDSSPGSELGRKPPSGTMEEVHRRLK